MTSGNLGYVRIVCYILATLAKPKAGQFLIPFQYLPLRLFYSSKDSNPSIPNKFSDDKMMENDSEGKDKEEVLLKIRDEKESLPFKH